MNSQERIAEALEEKNEIIMGILYGVLIGSLLVAGGFAVLIFGQSVFAFISYDLLGNERPKSPTYAVAPSHPIDDCSYSEDEQLCFQMKRIADALETSNISTGVLESQQKFSINEREMAEILSVQLKISNADLACDIDYLSQFHDKPICLSKLDTITPTDLGYILHGNKISAMMWMDEDEVIKMRGTNGISEVEYNGTVNEISIGDIDYYLITNAVFQGNHN